MPGRPKKSLFRYAKSFNVCLKNTMRKFLLRLGEFFIPAVLYSFLMLFLLPYLLVIQNGPNTKKQITVSFDNAATKNYKILILGNSRLYRGLNPEKFSLKAYNFSHDNDSYNQLYYKLEFLEENNKDFEYLILGVDYFQFGQFNSSRNWIYGGLLDKKYLADYDETFFWPKVRHHLSYLDPKKLLGLKPKENVPFLKENGQYVKPGRAKKDETVQRDIARHQLQVGYFEKILSFCKSKNIKVILVMPPTRKNELDSYSSKEIKEFNSFLDGYVNNRNVFYFNFSRLSSFDVSDFTDYTHLNAEAADDFSIILNEKLMTERDLGMK